MKTQERKLKERICALVLAFAMVLTWVLPDLTLTARAEGEEQASLTFVVQEAVPTDSDPDNKIAVQNAKVSVREKGSEEVLASEVTDKTGSVQFTDQAYESEKSYVYSVEKAGYETITDQPVDMSTGNPIQVSLSMEEIALKDIDILGISTDQAENQTNAVIENRIENAEVENAPEYVWSSSAENIAEVSKAGVITAVSKGQAVITVARNGKKASKTVTVKAEPVISIAVSPADGENTNQVTVSAELPKDTVGEKVQFQVNDNNYGEEVEIQEKENAEGETTGFASIEVNEGENLVLQGTTKFSVVYAGSDTNFYFAKTATTDGRYRKEKDLNLTKDKITVTYGDSVDKDGDALVIAATGEDRVLSYRIKEGTSVGVDDAGNLTINSVGTTVITVTAAENDKYTSASKEVTVTVEKKKLKNLELSSVKWEKTSKIYDGESECTIKGTISNENGLIDEDQIDVTATVNAVSKNVGKYTGFTVENTQDLKLSGDKSECYNISFDKEKNTVSLDQTIIEITKRPVYIKVAVKENASEEFEYGKSKEGLQEEIRGNYKVVLNGKTGEANSEDKKSGTIKGEKLDLTKKTKIVLNGVEDNNVHYYVQNEKYNKAVEISITANDYPNYELKLLDNDESFADLKIVKQNINLADFVNLVNVDVDGVITDKDNNETIWIRGNNASALKFAFKEENEFYDGISVLKKQDENGQDIWEDAVNNGITFDDTEDKEYTLKVKLTNSKSLTTETEPVEYIIHVDATAPTVEFNGLGTAGMFSDTLPKDWKVNEFVKEDTEIKITPAENGSGLYSIETYDFTVPNGSTNTDIGNQIQDALNNPMINWEKKSADVASVSVSVTAEGNHIILARVRDKVGNEAVYTSNGLVYDMSKPTVRIKINNEEPIDGEKVNAAVNEAGEFIHNEVAYTVTISDIKENVAVSGIESVTIKATDNDEEVTADSRNYSKADLEELSEKQADGTNTPAEGTLGYLMSKSEVAITGVMHVNQYHTAKNTLSVTAVDQAGHKSETAEKTVKLDVVPPEIQVEYNTDQAQNDKYIAAASRTMTIRYTERNFDENNLTFDGEIDGNEFNGVKLATLDKDLRISVEKENDSESNYVENAQHTDGRINTYKITFTGDGTYKVIPHIQDTAGNSNTGIKYTNTESKVNESFILDNTAPTVQVSFDNNDVKNGSHFNATRVMTVQYTETNFTEDGLSFNVNAENPEETISLDDLKTISGVTVSEGTTAGNVHTYEITFGEDEATDQDFHIVPYIEDLAGNTNKDESGNAIVTYAEGTEAPNDFTIDKVVPIIGVEYYYYTNEADKTGKVTISNMPDEEAERLYKNVTIYADVTITEHNFSNDEAFSENPKQMNLSCTATDSKGKDDKTIGGKYESEANTRGNWTDDGYVRKQTFTFDTDANYTFGLTYTDLAGNACTHENRYFTVDKTAPTGDIRINEKIWKELSEKVYFNIFSNKPVTVTMGYEDATSGIASVQYYKYKPSQEERGEFEGLTLKALNELPDNEWVMNAKATTSVDPNEQVIVYEKIVDKAGNVTYINNKEGVIADNKSPDAPVIEIKLAKPAKDIYNSNVPFSVYVKDPVAGGTYSGLKSVKYEIRNNEVISQEGNYDNALSVPSARVADISRSEVVDAAKNNSNHVTITVTAEDYAGNTSTKTENLKIDITRPEVTVTFDQNNPLNGKYYNMTRTATIAVKERNFDPDAAELKITNTDGTMPAVSGWNISSQAGESDEAVNTCTVTFSADGDYNMSMFCKDLAGNDSNTMTVDEFTIDQTIPTIAVSYDNNNAATPGYYNAKRTATVTVTEHNFNAAEVNAQITAALQGSGISAPSLGGWNTSGDVHTASVTFSADADYTFDVGYTDLAGNPAADYPQDSFTVDQTAPEVEFFDIVDKSANNGTVAPGVKYSDVNYTENGVDITIKGAKHNSEALSGERSSISNGESIKLPDFEHTEDKDDVYTMTAVITDKAGNKTEKQVMFSVNRFGSNYIYSDSTESFLNKVYSNAEQDLVVTEINVDTLVSNGISYSLDNKTTELKKGNDYTVKESGGDGSWKEYTYTISKKNFEKEGRYTVTIDSEDAATNTMNNKVKESPITFVIDKTSPTVVITGIEESSYRADSRDMTVNVSDNTAVKKLSIMVGGKEVATYDQQEIIKAGGQISYTIDSANSKQDIEAVAVDLAENETTSDHYSVLITSNLLIQYVNNTPLLVGSIVAVVLIAGGAIYFFGFKRKKKEAEA